MANPNRQAKPDTARSEQNIQNKSFDEEFQVSAIEQLTYNPVTNTLERVSGIQGNASLTISNTDTVVASTTVLTKTIGSDSYEKTISYNAGGDVVSVSAWVTV